MATTLDQQLLLHHAINLCDLARLRPATMPERDPFPILGRDLDRSDLMATLAPTLQLIWSEHPAEIPDDELEAFLVETRRRAVQRLTSLSGEDGFVPAAEWTENGRNTLLEHLSEEVDALVGGARAEGLWMAFGETDDTAPLAELIQTGMLIKLRVVGAFLTTNSSRHADEMTAADFFTAGAWAAAADTELVAEQVRRQKLIHKQIAHLTITRPRPSDKYVYRPSSYLSLVDDLLKLISQFTEAVDQRLLPEWWSEWAAGLNRRLGPWSSAEDQS